MSLDLYKLHLFVTVARLMSFTKAADTLHMTQPTVSQQIAALELQIGAKLIERDTRRLTLTPAGETLLLSAEKLLALADASLEATRSAAGLSVRTLRLGVGHTLATYLLPEVLSRYRTLHPDHMVRISVGNTAELLDLTDSGAVELALVGSPAIHPEIAVEPFMHDQLVVIVSPIDSWSGRQEVELETLRDRILITREPGSALHATVERLVGAARLADDTVIQLGETEAIKRCVEAGLGVALIQGIAVRREVAAGTLCSLALRHEENRRTYLCAHRRRHELSGIAREFIKVLSATLPYGGTLAC